MITPEYKKAYDMLNAQQRKAVDTIDGPVMVAAGPGTGKTQILAVRIARIIELSKAKPENILALTFTESGVHAMRNRLRKFVGSAAFEVGIFTFHGFADHIMRDHPELFADMQGSHVDDIDKIRILENIFTTTKFKLITSFGSKTHYIKPALSAISTLKREGIDPAEFREVLNVEQKRIQDLPDLTHEKGAHKGKVKAQYQKELKEVEKNRELAEVYEQYESRLTESGKYDFDDMILSVVRALKGSDELLQEYQEQFQYILVDEHQDTNKSQNTIVELLGSHTDSPSVFVVGDDKQAIYRFQGANLENFLHFKAVYPTAEVISLSTNYRSSQSILDVSHSLIEKNTQSLSQSLGADDSLQAFADNQGEKMRVHECKSSEAEIEFVASDIAKQIKNGINPEQIAVLYTRNWDGIPLAAALQRAEVEYSLESKQDILSQAPVQRLIELLRGVHAFGSDEHFARLLQLDILGLDPLDVFGLITFSGDHRVSMHKILKSPDQFPKLSLGHPEQLQQFWNLYEHWKIGSSNKTAVDIVAEIIRESGLLKWVLNHDSYIEYNRYLSAFYDIVKSLARANPRSSLQDVVNHVNLLQEHNVMIEKRGESAVPNAVRLMTAYGSKGLEFDYVYVLHANSGVWSKKRSYGPNFKLPSAVFSYSISSSESQSLDDERRLFYVALTRAREQVIATYATQKSDGKELVSTQFLDEVEGSLVHRADGQRRETDFIQTIAQAKTRVVDDTRLKQFVATRFNTKGLSATALNNYLTCPWRYFYVNLLSIPQAKTKYLQFGTAVHAALNFARETVNGNRTPSKSDIYQAFEQSLSREAVSQDDYEELLEKGQEVLDGYTNQYSESWKPGSQLEFSIRGVEMGDIVLNGQLDRIDTLVPAPEGQPAEVLVVDYKTGKPKSRNVIEGKTAYSNGDIYRQLVFYRLLLSLYQDGSVYNMTRGLIDFVEPTERGGFKQEEFEIEQNEVEALAKQIKQVAQEIKNLDFMNHRCEDECEWCELGRNIQRVQSEVGETLETVST